MRHSVKLLSLTVFATIVSKSLFVQDSEATMASFQPDTQIIFSPISLTQADTEDQNLERAIRDFETGGQLLRDGDLRQSVELLESAYDYFCDETRDITTVEEFYYCIDSLGNLGVANAALGNHEESEYYYNLLSPYVGTTRYTKYPWQESLLLIDIAQQRGNGIQDSESNFNPTSLGLRGGEPTSRLQDTGNIYLSLGQYQAAIDYYQNTLRYGYDNYYDYNNFRFDAFDSIDRLQVLNNIGLAYSYLGRYAQAENGSP